MNPDGCEVLLVRHISNQLFQKGGRVQQDLPPISLNASNTVELNNLA